MEKSILITGGARSGKSALAERLTLKMTGQGIYIATAQTFDDEMRSRIALHQARRGAEWSTINAPFALADALYKSDNSHPRLVDCLTLWLSNLMLNQEDWHAHGQRLVNVISEQQSPVVFVTNEVGAGIVPENKLARDFRDAAGWLNQTIAATCESVWLSIAGYPIRVKPNEHHF